LSGYNVPDHFFVNSEEELIQKTENTPFYQDYLQQWKDKAIIEKNNVLTNIAAMLK
jgi:hypothetical protein